MYRIGTVLFLLMVIIGCGGRIYPVATHFNPHEIPPTPDYSRTAHWASLPEKSDAADSIPLRSTLKNNQADALADVFFVYPTIYTGKPGIHHPWNADVNDTVLNRLIQGFTILNQATIFNGSCRVYAPYYRQAHLYAFYTPDAPDREQALELAYQDVKTAFQFYLEHHNQGRPIVIASHSQGSYHAMRLLQEFFDGKPLQRQLVAAYLVGRAIPRDAFGHIHPGDRPDEVGVWMSWNTFRKGYVPSSYATDYATALSVNPLLWNTSEAYAPKERNPGGVGLNFTLVPALADAQNHKNLLWINRPYVKGRALLRRKIWHRADMNLFYMNIRENIEVRLRAFLGR